LIQLTAELRLACRGRFDPLRQSWGRWACRRLAYGAGRRLSRSTDWRKGTILSMS